MSFFHFEKDDIPLWEHIGLTPNFTFDEVLIACRGLSQEQKQDSSIRLAWKVLIDPYYAEMYRSYPSSKMLEHSGFFVDSYEGDVPYHLNLLTTPYDKIVDGISKAQNTDKPYIVLLTTGSYSPIHKSHVEIMDIAKKTMEESGYQVVGGYISPSHDEYVSVKDAGRAALTIEKRAYLIEKVLEFSPWLYVDKWEGYYNAFAVNFTDVILRLESYLNKHISTRNQIRVCYVFGGDNAPFARTFKERGYAVCVNRDGYGKRFEAMKEELHSSPNVFFDQSEESTWVSSTLVRSGHYEFLEKEIVDLYKDIICGNFQTSISDKYAIRNDLSRAFPLSDTDMQDTVEIMSKALVESFNGQMTVKVISCEEQQKNAEEIISSLGKQTLSLDVYVRGDINLDISRLFELGGIQFKAKGLINRPGTPSLEEQTQSFPAGEYVLIEDDVVSGYTVSKALGMLSNEMVVNDMIILSHLDIVNKDEAFFDVIDMRDFIFGAKHGGLVTTLPNGEISRVPYVLPYVSPITRASIPIGKELSFSIRIWELNRDFFTKHPRFLSEMDENLIRLMEYIGFSKDHSMVEIVEWHLNQLQCTN